MFFLQTFILKQCLSGKVLHNSLLHLLLKNGDCWNTDISQGSEATRLGCNGVFVHDFVTNFLLSLTVKEFWKSVNTLWSYGQELGVLFFLTHSVDLLLTLTLTRRFVIGRRTASKRTEMFTTSVHFARLRNYNTGATDSSDHPVGQVDVRKIHGGTSGQTSPSRRFTSQSRSHG